jgi:hypothetical protein
MTIDFEQVLDISIPTGLVSPTPNFERPSQRDFLRFVRARVENAVDIDIKSLPERAKSMLADIVEDCYIQFGLLYQTTQEARQRTSSLTRACQQPPDNETLQMETQQQTYWDTMEYSSSQGGVQSKGKGTQINRVAPPPLSFAVAPPLQTPGADSNRSNCSCIGQCTCSAPTSSASVVPDMDFGDSDLYMREYETLWNGGPTDMNLFNSFVNDEDRSFFHPEL